MSKIRVTGFRWVPPIVQGLVRDLRVRWALQEAGIAYEERLIGRDEQASAAYRTEQPFGQVPVYEEDDLVLFESGAIVLHIAEGSSALMPTERNARLATRTWMFAAIDSVGQIENLTDLDLFCAGEDWAKARRPGLVQDVQRRLSDLARHLDTRDYLVGDRFSAADLLMTATLRTVRHTTLVTDIGPLARFQQRCEARPAFQKALAEQMAAYRRHAPPAQAPTNT